MHETPPYRTPGRTVDETEIERAKVHEAAETKRKLIAEREATKRARMKELGLVPSVVTGAVLLAAIGGATCAATSHYEHKYPPPAPAALPDPSKCVERVEVISWSTPTRECGGGGHIETRDLGKGEVEWKCLCGPRPDAGAP